LKSILQKRKKQAMQENEFEKKVREEIGGLRLRPSEEVWGKVEAELKRKKRRRVVVFIFLLAGLSLIGTTGYFLWNNEKQNLAEEKTLIPANEKPVDDNSIVKSPETKESTQTGQTKREQPVSTDERKKETDGIKDIATDKISESKNDIGASQTTEKTIVKGDDIVSKTDAKQTSIETKRKTRGADKEIALTKKKVTPEKELTIAAKDEDVTIVKQEPAARPEKLKEKAIEQNDIVSKTDAKQTSIETKRKTRGADKEIAAAKKKVTPEKELAIAAKDEDVTIVKQEPVEKPTKLKEDVIAQNDNSIKQDSIAVASIAAEKKNETATIKDSAITVLLPEEEKINKASKTIARLPIKLGVSFSAGISNLGDDIFSIPSVAKSADQLYSTPGGATNNPAPTPFYPPSSIKAGTAFKIGVIAEKQLTKKSSLVAGLQYAYLSNNIKTGMVKDTAIALYDRNNAQSLSLSSVYSGKHEKEYTNKYHLIELPVHYQWQLNKGKKLPILWNMGLSAGYLVSSNALLFDTTAGGIHYRNKDAYSKVQLNLNTGLFFRLGGKKLQWSIGPELSMATRRLLKDETQPKQYFLYGGLTGRLLFIKKK
jgi:hypothetical protein